MQAWVGSNLIGATASSVLARISSRITTGIRVVMIFTETIAVVMSHSQFRRT